MATPKGGFAALAILGLPILIALLLFGPAAFDLVFHRRAPERYLIPAGFTGWTRIEFRKRGAPPLPIEDGHRVLRLDSEGNLSTSSDPPHGHGGDDFYYYTPTDASGRSSSANPSSEKRRTRLSNAGVCKGGMIWQVETLVDDPSGTPFIRFFVGTEAQYRHEADPSGNNLPACE
jgi:hypothetical protein